MKFNISALLTLSLLLLTVTAIAGNDRIKSSEIEELDFETRKQMVSDRLAVQLERVSAHKACIDNAYEDEALKSCNKQARQAMRDAGPHKGQINKKGMRKRYKEMQQEHDASATH